MGEVRDKKCLSLAASMIKRSTLQHRTIFLNDVPLPNARIGQGINKGSLEAQTYI